MTVWWYNNRRRLRAERVAIEELETSSDWLANVEWSFDGDLRLRAVFDICLAHSNFRLQMIYHNTFPSSPPSVSPVEDVYLSSHQYGRGGDLCLQIRPDNWSPTDYTGADIIQSAYQLFVEETPENDGTVSVAPTSHNVPHTLEMRGAILRLYLSVATQQILESSNLDQANVKLGFNYHRCGRFQMVVLVNALKKDDFFWSPPDVPSALTDEALVHDGVLIYTSLNGEALSKISSEDELITALSVGVPSSDHDYYYLVVSVDSEVALFFKRNGSFFSCTTILQPREIVSRSGDELKKITSKRVGVVGLGSLGSKVAISLARAGVKNFVLVDGDVLHAGNLERHDADWRDIGLHKADIMARRLRLISPQIDCDSRRTMIGAQVSAKEAGNVCAVLSSCDLIFDATAEVEVFNHLAGLATISNATLVWGAVFAGGIGGVVGRSRSQKDPSPFHIRNSINQVYDSFDVTAPSAAQGSGYGSDNGDLIMAAPDSTVSAVASLATDFSLDALVEREPSRYGAHAYLVGYAQGWIFEGPFHVQPIISDAPVRVDECQLDEENMELDFLGDLIRKRTGEIENSSSNS